MAKRAPQENVDYADSESDGELPKGKDVTLLSDQKFEDHYKPDKELGKGKFGVVKLCTSKSTGEAFAAKFIKITQQTKDDTAQEIAMMNIFHHKKLVRVMDAFLTPKEIIVVMEYISGGELFEKIADEDCLSEKQAVNYLKQVLKGIRHMHQKKVVHLDLKPENILVLGAQGPANEKIKLIDFGLARKIEPGKKLTVACGTPEFVAPEVINLEPIDVSADMWSIGVITYVLLSGLSPFMGDTDAETLNNVSSGEWDFETEDNLFDEISDEAKDFIEKLVVTKASDRMTMDECFKHPWIHCSKTLDKRLKVENLKKFVARRRWQKTATAIRAIGRLGNLSLLANLTSSNKKS